VILAIDLGVVHDEVSPLEEATAVLLARLQHLVPVADLPGLYVLEQRAGNGVAVLDAVLDLIIVR